MKIVHPLKLLFNYTPLALSIALLTICFPGFSQFASSDFLKANGMYLRNQSGAGSIVSLHGTNLGSWLSMEGWIAPLGEAYLNRTGWTATASTTYTGTSPSYALDGDTTTRWSTGISQQSSSPQWFRVDMGASRIISKVLFEVNSYAGDYPKTYDVFVSEDGTNWTNVSTDTANIKITSVWIYPQKARYIQINQTGTSANWWSITEFNASNDDDYSVRNKLITRFGLTAADQLWDYYQNLWIQSTDLDKIKAMGMNMVRVPIYWMELMNDDGTIKSGAWTQIDWIVNQCNTRKIYVILDLHGTPGGLNGYYTGGQAITNDLWSNSTYQTMTVNIWKAIATRYKNNPAVAAYDLLNEPETNNPNLPINTFYNTLYQAVRAIDANHTITVQAFKDFWYLGSPASNGWTNVLYQTHYYDDHDLHDHDAQSAFADSKISDMVRYQKEWNVPVYAGEYNFWNFTDLWQKWMNALNSTNISWSNWTYKNKDNHNNNWGFYDINNNLTPDMNVGSQSAIKARWDKFTTANFRTNTALINTVIPFTTAAPFNNINNNIWLKGVNAKFVSSQNGTNPMMCDRTTVSSWERFTVVDAGNGFIALQGSNGKYVSSQNGQSAMTCVSTTIGSWESFRWVNLGSNYVALLGTGGFVSSENGQSSMTSSRNSFSEWETFTWGTSASGAKMASVKEKTDGLANRTFSIFPNPASKNIYYTVPAGFENHTVVITTLSGVAVLSEKHSNYKRVNAVSIQYFSKGFYMISLSNGFKRVTAKVLIE